MMTSTPKQPTDSSYLMSMMDSVGKSDMDGLLNQTAYTLKKPRRIENLVSGAITRNIYTEGITKKAAVSKSTKGRTRIFTATPKETAALKRLNLKILSPKLKPPVCIHVISPSATRSGTLLRRHYGGTNE